MATPAKKIPTDLAEAHKLIGDELSFLYTKWNCYKLLFCTADETVALLHNAAAFFFMIYRQVLRDDIILTLCRLTDRPTTKVKGENKSNLTVKHLLTMIPPSDAALRKVVDTDREGIASKSVNFCQHRHRRIAHCDLNTRRKCETALLPNLGLNEMDDVLASIASLLNDIGQFYGQDERPYGEGIYGSGNAQDLIDFINYEQKLRQYFNDKEFGG